MSIPCVLRHISLKDKSDAAKIFQTFHKMVQNQFQKRKKKIQILRTNKKKNFSEILGKYLDENGIINQFLVQIHHNKMEWQRGKIDIFLKWLGLYC